MHINPIRLGLAFGIFLALVHGAWAALVALDWAQPLMNFVFWAHFIAPPYHIELFDLSRAALLIGLVFVTGSVCGGVGALLWNRFASIN